MRVVLGNPIAAWLAGTGLAVLLLSAPSSAAQSAEEVEATSLSGTYLAARTADAGKDLPSAAEFYSSALVADSDNLFLLERALLLSAAAGRNDDALGFARDLIARAPSSPVAKLIIAADHIKAGSYAEAISTLQGSSGSVVAELTGGLLTAWARFGEGEVDKAVADLAAMKVDEAFEPFRLLHSGYILLASGRTEEAITVLAKAHGLDANTVRITEAYARALAIAGRTDEAIKVLQEFLDRSPENPLVLRAIDAVRSGKPVITPVGTPVGGVAEALAGIGGMVGQEGGLEIAALYLQLALHLDRDTSGGLAALSLGTLLEASNQSEAAIAAFGSIAPDAPVRALGVLRAALTLDRMDRTEDAEKAFKEAIARDPDDVQVYVSYGNMLRGRDRYDESAAVFTQAIERTPKPVRDDWGLFYARGIAFERTKQWDKAEADFKRALELFPDQPLVLNYLGYSWVDKGENLDQALGMIRKAVELRSSDGFIVDSLGWAYYRLGRYEDAVTELERAISLQAEDPVIHDHLGDAYWKTGRILEAQFQWRHARDLGAKGEELELILKKIAEGRLIEAQKDAAFAPAAAEPAWRAGQSNALGPA